MASPRLPRLLTAEEAADYCGRLPLAEFRRLGWGRVRDLRSERYDIIALDAQLDALAGLSPKSTPDAHNDAIDDPEAALDRFIKRA